MRDRRILLGGWLGASLLLAIPLAGCSGTTDDDDQTEGDDDASNVSSPTPMPSPGTTSTPTMTPTATPGVTPTATPGETGTPTATPGGTPGTTETPGTTPTEPPASPTPTSPTPSSLCGGMTPVSVEDLQTNPDLINTVVKVTSLIASSGLTPPDTGHNQAFYAQDSSLAANSGIRILIPQDSGIAIAPGTQVTACGTLQERNANTQLVIDNVLNLSIDGATTPVAPVDLDACTLGGADGESYEGMLVRVAEVKVTNSAVGGGTFEVDDCLQVGTEFFPYQNPPIPRDGQGYHYIVGPLLDVSGNHRIEPRSTEDLIEALFSYATPAGGSFVTSVDVTILANQPNSVVYYTLDGSEPSMASESINAGQSITIDQPNTLKFFAVSDTESESDIHEEVYDIAGAGSKLLLTEVAILGDTQEFIELYNPTTDAISLKDYYLTDLSNTNSTTKLPDNQFVNIVNGNAKSDVNDFLVKFPDDATIEPGAFKVVVIHKADSSGNPQALDPAIHPDYEIADTSAEIPNMLPAGGTTVNIKSVGLSNSKEFVLLFTWDGTSPLVKDVDYFRWSSDGSFVGVDRTGLTMTVTSSGASATYAADTKPADQQALGTSLSPGQSFCRTDLKEGTQVQTGGNGVNGEDETSENLGMADQPGTWKICSSFTPGSF